jgi:transcription termination factor NusB
VPFPFDEPVSGAIVQCDTLPLREQRVVAFYLLYMLDAVNYELSTEAVIDQFSRGYSCIINPEGFIVNRTLAIVRERNELDTEIKPLLQNWKLERLSVSTKLIKEHRFRCTGRY